MSHRLIAILIVWVAVIVGLHGMKKIEPTNKWYLPYAIINGIIFTAILLYL